LCFVAVGRIKLVGLACGWIIFKDRRFGYPNPEKSPTAEVAGKYDHIPCIFSESDVLSKC